MTGDRERGAARELIFSMLGRAIREQRDGGESLDVVVTLDGPAARTLGLWGEGEIRLQLRPCTTPELPSRANQLRHKTAREQ